MNTGFEFIKKIKPLGCVLVIICFVGFLGMCFTSGGDEPLPGYTPSHDAAYYAANLPELASELNQNVLPYLSGSGVCAVDGDKVAVTVDKKNFFAVRSALLKYFDESLLDIRKTEWSERG